MSTGAYARATVRTEWFVEDVKTTVGTKFRRRGDAAAEHLRKKIVKNLSSSGGFQGAASSKPGEFPKEQTSTLKNSITVEANEVGGVTSISVGTPLVYGVALETRLKRSFLLRTLNEELSSLRQVIGSG